MGQVVGVLDMLSRVHTTPKAVSKCSRLAMHILSPTHDHIQCSARYTLVRMSLVEDLECDCIFSLSEGRSCTGSTVRSPCRGCVQNLSLA